MIVSSYTGTDNTIITYTAGTHTVKIFNDSDLTLSGALLAPYEQDITVAIQGDSGALSITDTFTVTVKNPCVNIVSISNQADQVDTYQIGLPKIEFDYASKFSVTLDPLCGPITYTVTTSSTLIVH